MRSSRGEIVVGFVGMSKLAVGKCRLDGSTQDLGGNYRGNFLATVGTSKLDRHVARRQLGSRNHSSDGVENVMPCLLLYLVGQCAVAGLGHVWAEVLHHRADVLDHSRRQAA